MKERARGSILYWTQQLLIDAGDRIAGEYQWSANAAGSVGGLRRSRAYRWTNSTGNDLMAAGESPTTPMR